MDNHESGKDIDGYMHPAKGENSAIEEDDRDFSRDLDETVEDFVEKLILTGLTDVSQNC
jgi:hypothetical protein